MECPTPKTAPPRRFGRWPICVFRPTLARTNATRGWRILGLLSWPKCVFRPTPARTNATSLIFKITPSLLIFSASPSWPKMAPRWRQVGRRWRQNGTKLAEDGAKMARDGAIAPCALWISISYLSRMMARAWRLQRPCSRIVYTRRLHT